MCDATGNRDADDNSVTISGQMGGPLALYFAKEQPRFEFDVRSVTPWHTVHKVRIQARGQAAHDLLMLYQFGRKVAVKGYLKHRRRGYLCVVVQEFAVAEIARYFTLDDLYEKVKMLTNAEARKGQDQSETPESSDDLPTAADSILDDEVGGSPHDDDAEDTDPDEEFVDEEDLIPSDSADSGSTTPPTTPPPQSSEGGAVQP